MQAFYRCFFLTLAKCSLLIIELFIKTNLYKTPLIPKTFEETEFLDPIQQSLFFVR